MKFEKAPLPPPEQISILRKQYLELSAEEKSQRRLLNFRNICATVLFFLIWVAVPVVSINLYILIPFPSALGLRILYIAASFAVIGLSIIAGFFLGMLLASPLFGKYTSDLNKKRRHLLSEGAVGLREFYKLTEPCLVTKCYECKGNDKFNMHDVCIFVVGDELRITTNLLHGFLNPEHDLGCYAFSKDEVTLGLIEYGQTTAATLSCEEITFILGRRAYGFIQKQFFYLQGDKMMSISDTHHMKLHPAPFAAIQSGRKTVELRLNDEKRQRIKVGDSIVFTQTETGEIIRAVVLDIRKYPDFDAMYQAEDSLTMGYDEGDVADPRDMSQYYNDDEIRRYGTLAIEIRRIEQ